MERTQISKIRNEKEVTTDTTEIQRIIRDYYKQLHVNKMTNLEEMHRFLYNILRLNKKEMENINRPITSTDIEIVIKKLANKQKSRITWLHTQIPSNI